MNMEEHIKDQDKEIYELIARVIEVIKDNGLWSESDTYTFNDGEVWRKFDPDNSNGDTV